MSTEPLPGPDPYDEPPSRLRWVVPAAIGLSIGILIGGAAIFIVMSLANRPRTTELAAEKFDIQAVLTSTPGAEDVSPGNNSTDYLGTMGRRMNSGTAVHRRITLSGSVRSTTDVSSLGQTLKAQIDAELSRHGAFTSGGGSSTTSGGNEYTHKWDSSYYTRDGRRGCVDGEIVIRQGTLQGFIIITEGR
jgi:hypothetical protein